MKSPKPKAGTTITSFRQGLMISNTIARWEDNVAVMDNGKRVAWNHITGFLNEPFEAVGRRR